MTAALKVMSRSKADAEYQRAKGHATSAQIEERKRLDWRYLRYPAKDWMCAICAIQQKTGFALSALTSKETGLSTICKDVRNISEYLGLFYTFMMKQLVML